MTMPPRIGALIYVEGRSKAEKIRDAVLSGNTVVLDTAEAVQAALEAVAKAENITFWDWPSHVARWEGLAEIKEKEDLRR